MNPQQLQEQQAAVEKFVNEFVPSGFSLHVYNEHPDYTCHQDVYTKPSICFDVMENALNNQVYQFGWAGIEWNGKQWVATKCERQRTTRDNIADDIAQKVADRLNS